MSPGARAPADPSADSPKESDWVWPGTPDGAGGEFDDKEEDEDDKAVEAAEEAREAVEGDSATAVARGVSGSRRAAALATPID
ncbi:hypothetical protein ACTWQF_21635 [Streptomyces sp. 8N114]|uniref:hypothetical protein n=1 Tax=Streptomyces sp. 8N114 TaxID=3457419 RepID=UPI003FD6B099